MYLQTRLALKQADQISYKQYWSHLILCVFLTQSAYSVTIFCVLQKKKKQCKLITTQTVKQFSLFYLQKKNI